MKYYQVEHDICLSYNCELYEDSYSYREDKIYTSKEQLDDFRDDMITIHEIEIVDNK